MHSNRAGKIGSKASVAGLVLLALASCTKPKPVVVEAPPPPPAPAPVGHVYATMVQVPPPVSPRIKFPADQYVQIQKAFNVIGLKSALMVAALSCGDQDKYDSFMTEFQPYVLAEQHVIDLYFYKASGPYSGKKMEDTFVTLLANNQSVSGIAQGRVFCLNNSAEFNAVLALKTPEALDAFVTGNAPIETDAPAESVPVHHFVVHNAYRHHVVYRHHIVRTAHSVHKPPEKHSETAAK